MSRPRPPCPCRATRAPSSSRRAPASSPASTSRAKSCARSIRRCPIETLARRRAIVPSPASAWPGCAGPAAAMLSAERTALNFLQHLSGIATLTRRFVDAAGGRDRRFSTRARPCRRCARSRSTPCAAAAARITASGSTTRVLIKDNHIRMRRRDRSRRSRACASYAPGRTIEVEAQSLARGRRRASRPAPTSSCSTT